MELLKGAAQKAYNSLLELDMPISAEQVKHKLTNKDLESRTLLQAFEYHNRLLEKRLGVEVSKATIVKYLTLTKKVERFINCKIQSR